MLAFRLSSWDTPCWVLPNRSPGRFNRSGSGATQYFCCHPLGPWAEYMRRAHLISAEELLQVAMRIWVGRIPTSQVVDVSFDTARSFGLDPQDLVSDDYTKCQDFAERCRGNPELPKVIRVPSAALPGSDNIVVFGPRVLAPFQVEAVSDIDLPASVVAEDSRPLHTLVENVRYFGGAHAALEAWHRGEQFRLEEPPTPLFSFDH